MVDGEWKKRFEVACEKKAKDVLMELGDEYESKYQRLQSELRNANEEIARLRADHGEHDEGLKKAFMRGVCALNMEAMSVLLKNQHGTESNEEQSRRALLRMFTEVLRTVEETSLCPFRFEECRRSVHRRGYSAVGLIDCGR